jgi:hypothetical protein
MIDTDLKYQGKTPLDYQYIPNQNKKWRAEGKNKSFSWDGYQWEVGGHKERGNEDVYGGCILYPSMKIEDWNLLKLL